MTNEYYEFNLVSRDIVSEELSTHIATMINQVIPHSISMAFASLCG